MSSVSITTQHSLTFPESNHSTIQPKAKSSQTEIPEPSKNSTQHDATTNVNVYYNRHANTFGGGNTNPSDESQVETFNQLVEDKIDYVFAEHTYPQTRGNPLQNFSEAAEKIYGPGIYKAFPNYNPDSPPTLNTEELNGMQRMLLRKYTAGVVYAVLHKTPLFGTCYLDTAERSMANLKENCDLSAQMAPEEKIKESNQQVMIDLRDRDKDGCAILNAFDEHYRGKTAGFTVGHLHDIEQYNGNPNIKISVRYDYCPRKRGEQT